MTSRLLVTECLIDANRALEDLREKVTAAFVRAESVAKSMERHGDEDAQGQAAAWWKLALEIRALNEMVYAQEIDVRIIDLVRESAVLPS